jgi:hypothetical protein
MLCFHTGILLQAYSQTFKVEATCSSETSVSLSHDYTALYFRRQNVYNHRCENRRSYGYKRFPWRCLRKIPSSGVRCRVDLVRNDDSEEGIISIIKVIRISVLLTTLAVTSV